MRRFVAFTGLLIGLAHASLSRAAGEASPTNQGEPGSLDGLPAVAAAAARASIVYTADGVDHDDLFALITELLGRESVGCDVTSTSHFDADDLFAPADATGVRVFVRVDASGTAHLYFRGPAGQRFLLRKLTLPNHLDDVGKELIGQVVASSVIALLRSSIGLSREQASNALARELRAAPPNAGEQVTAATAPAAQERASVAYFAGLRYQGRYAGPDLGIEQGPGVELAVGRAQSPLLRGRCTLERDFQRELADPDLTILVQTYAIRASIDYGVRLMERQVLWFALGAGVDMVRLGPGAVHASAVVPFASHVDRITVVRPELRYELAYRSLRLGLAGFADIADVRTHYLLAGTTPPRRLASPWQARPGAAVVAGFGW